MAVAYYIFGALLAIGLAGAIKPAYFENVRNGARIVSGWPAEDGQIPHQVSLRMTNATGTVSTCGGSVIHHNWVLTAAHCAINKVSFVVRFGVTNLTRPELLLETTRVFINPLYTIEDDSNVGTDDIALLQFDEFVEFTQNIQPIRIQSSEQKNDNYTGVRFTVSGFGQTDDTWNGGRPSQILLWVYMRGITLALCREMYENAPIIKDQTLCAQYYNLTSQSTCYGDSGGPLTFIDVDGELTLAGIVSFGSSEGCNNIFPTAFVRPGFYHEWLTEVTGIDFDWTYGDLITKTEE